MGGIKRLEVLVEFHETSALSDRRGTFCVKERNCGPEPHGFQSNLSGTKAEHGRDAIIICPDGVIHGQVCLKSAVIVATNADIECSVIALENELGGVQLFDASGKKESAVGDAYHVKWIPALYLIDEKGKIQLGTVVASKVANALKPQKQGRTPQKVN